MRVPKTRRRNSILNVHAVLPSSCANGPGVRAVVWTQGCSRQCPGCRNPLTHSHEPRTLVEPDQLAEAIAAIPGVEGLTVSGGEPFEQASAVARLCKIVRQSGLSVMVFTGWTYQGIRSSKDKAVKRLLTQVDILVDGPFIRELADPKLRWRGSSNQKVWFLTDRYGPEVLDSADHTQLEVRLDAAGPLQITGFADDADLGLLAHRLAAEAGILLTATANDPASTSKKGRATARYPRPGDSDDYERNAL